ncbi:hydantoinase/oxoprolinase family protein [Salipiger mucosus]|uniref:N-methylhydantoinase A n=1 Tax=Salipiger mucosus DSM 16094 TaxID=1123237 RepID=S9S4V2_9RHOB|nr:hydantoinase/oxoprolinase family protein [Salipiger mucosus]EPX85220.1 N-methylhydantoinase A [Salipiger mucosus DSM 16094]
MLRIGVDIGGTFTDFCGWRQGQSEPVATFKVPSTPPNFEDGFREGFERMLDLLEPEPGQPAYVFHGTTVSTNAIIERTGSRLAAFVTEGYKDMLELQRFGLRNPLNLFETRVKPLVDRPMVFEIAERRMREGALRTPLDPEQVRAQVRAARDAGAEAFVVALLHSYADASHEQAVAGIIREEVGPDADISLSSEIWPRPGEYERALLAVLNAFVKRRMGDYVGAVETYVAGRLPGSHLFVTRSNGGAMSSGDAVEHPVHTLLSGPASGVTAVQYLGNLIGEDNILTMDMGGTSTDISLITDGQTLTTGSAEVGDFPLVMPVTGVEAIGAGGGSIIQMDGGMLRVGPQSAGARPGPACFGRGGTRPTLTDAYLLSGYLPEALLGGEMTLDRAAAEAALAPVARELGCDVPAAAEMAVRVASSNMEAGVLPFVARYGVDPEDLTLIVYGGGGALHGPIFAREIGVKRIVVPGVPSVFCAYGGLVSEVRHDLTTSVQGRSVTADDIAGIFADLRGQASDWLDQQVDASLLEEVDYEYWSEMRYAGQSFEVDVQLSQEAVENRDLAAMQQAFHVAHEKLYSHCDPSSPTEFVHFRVRVKGRMPMPSEPRGMGTGAGEPRPQTRREIRFAGQAYPDTAVYAREDLWEGAHLSGPCVVQQRDATVLVPPGYSLECAAYDNLVISKD